MELNTAIEKYYKLQAKLAAYGHAMSLIYYDGSTTAPKDTAANRGRALSVLSEESYLLSTGKETVELLEFLDDHKKELSEKDARSVYLALKDIREMQKIPMDEYIEYQEVLVEADDVWHRAKEENNFAMFFPCLVKIFDFEKRFARYCAPDMHPYNYCLNKYEDGLTMEKCDKFFAALKSRIVPLIKKIGEKEQIDDSCIYGSFPASEQESFGLALMDVMGIDKGHCGLATTEHPFTTSLGSHHDVRITTNYKEDNFASSMFSVIHEGGHALYDMNSADELAYTNLDGGVSMGIHESQSRFYENLLGRSREFAEYIFPTVKKCFPSLEKYTAEDFYRAINKVEPSLIRVEADEVTYALHVMIRYELEKAVMNGDITVLDLPREWNRLYKEYLGVDVPSDKDGVLQDSHWSGGAIGYFPSYALGSAYGAQFLKKMRETVDVEKCLETGDFAPINEWNKENIWKHGCRYTPAELLDRILGEPFDPYVFTDYLEKKYGEIYGL
ncbi:MAG: carboxypeptidase M32 [Ruminococcaceae bacterium]|nr:carboxypeptidase M32 [Oscillospiraceae bacterium]